MGCTCTQPKKDQAKQPQRKHNYEVKDQNGENLQPKQNLPPAKKIGKQQNLQVEKASILSEIYLRPDSIVEMSVKEEVKFINLIKENNIENLSKFVGYELDPPLILLSGRKVSTQYWNPLTFALVLGKQDLFNFIFKQLKFNLKTLLQHESQISGHRQSQNQPILSENTEAELMNPVFQLMIENESQLFKTLLNDYSYLFKTSNLKQLIKISARSTKPAQFLDLILQSKAFKSLYYQKVSSITKYKSSFEQFYEKYLSPFTHDKQAVEVLYKNLIQSPYSAGFGTFIVQNMKKCKDLFDIPSEQVIAKCQSELKEFDVYRLGNLGDADFKELERLAKKDISSEPALKAFNDFLQNLLKHIKGRDSVEQKVQKLLVAAHKGDLSGVKSKIGSSDIPKEAVSYLTGLEIPELKFKVQGSNDDFEMENTSQMNALELASMMGHSKIVTYFIDELQLKSQKDFQQHAKQGMVDQMNFILGPIFKQEANTLQALLDLSHFWNYEEISTIAKIMKQTKWIQGVSIILNSKSAKEIFVNSLLSERFRFVRDFLILPFRIDNVNESQSDISQDMMEQNTPSRRKTKQQNFLSNDEKQKLRTLIKTRFTSTPYTAAFLFQEFAVRRDTYAKDSEVNILPETPQDSLNFLTQSIDNVNDLELHEFIYETHGSVVNTLQKYLDALSISQGQDQEFGGNEKKVYEEIERLIKKLTDHQTYKKLFNYDNDENGRDDNKI